MKKQLLISALALAATSSAFANGLELEVGYERQNIDFDGGEIDVRGDLTIGAAYVSFGYRVDFNEKTSGTIEAIYAEGILDDEVGIFSFDDSDSYGVGYRVTHKLQGDWALYGRVDYRQLDLRVEDFFDSDPQISEKALGFGVGLDWRGLTFGYSAFTGDLDDLQTLHIGYRFRFGDTK